MFNSVYKLFLDLNKIGFNSQKFRTFLFILFLILSVTMIALEDYFSIQIFFIILRETLETAIIISVLLSFINQRHDGPRCNDQGDEHMIEGSIDTLELQKAENIKGKLKLQVWLGAVAGLTLCLFIGLVFILAFYYIGQDYWSYTERIWEGSFSILSSLIITIMGLGLLRINKIMKVKWWMKLSHAYNSEDVSKYGTNNEVNGEEPPVGKGKLSAKYFLAILPFVTTLREGLEAVVFVGGIGVSHALSSIPLSIVCGVTLGSIIGYFLYKGGNKLSLQYFLIVLTCFLYLVSAGLMSRGTWFLELEQFVRNCGGIDPSETGSGPGSYDISKSVWHVNCCNGLTDGWWMVFNAILGWTNSATYGSVITYCVYWLVVIIWIELKLHEEKIGYLPFLPMKWQLKRMKQKLKLYATAKSPKHDDREPITTPASSSIVSHSNNSPVNEEAQSLLTNQET